MSALLLLLLKAIACVYKNPDTQRLSQEEILWRYISHILSSRLPKVYTALGIKMKEKKQKPRLASIPNHMSRDFICDLNHKIKQSLKILMRF